ncbi:hypothetical protein E4K10_30945 [Streptomyces sp. T1317-0309]|nr:hypothetical protein E4K10_30945 [Streptomyces sp. T1317-0309]
MLTRPAAAVRAHSGRWPGLTWWWTTSVAMIRMRSVGQPAVARRTWEPHRVEMTMLEERLLGRTARTSQGLDDISAPPQRIAPPTAPPHRRTMRPRRRSTPHWRASTAPCFRCPRR